MFNEKDPLVQKDLIAKYLGIDLGYSLGLQYALNEDNTLSVKGVGECREAVIRIPSIYAGIPVTKISDGAFLRCSNLGNYAINDDLNLTTINIPASVQYIGESAVSNCINITVDVDNKEFCAEDGVLFSKDKKTLLCYPTLKPESFYVIPQGVEIVGKQAFYECNSLLSVYYPKTLKSIEISAFARCRSLHSFRRYGERCLKKLTVCDLAFSNSALRSFTLTNNIDYIGRAAFFDCKDLDLTSWLDEKERSELFEKWHPDWDIKSYHPQVRHNVSDDDFDAYLLGNDVFDDVDFELQ